MTPVDYRDHRRFEAVELGEKRAAERGWCFTPDTDHVEPLWLRTGKFIWTGLLSPKAIIPLLILAGMITLLLNYGE